MEDDEFVSSRRRILETGALVTVGGTVGCLRLSGSAGETATNTSPETESATATPRGTATPQGTATDSTQTPSESDTATQSPDGTPESEPENAAFEFEFRPADQQLAVTYTGGGRLRAGTVWLESTGGKRVTWPKLGSTLAAAEEVLTEGATAVLGPQILNWATPVGRDETIRVVFRGEGSPSTLARFTPPETASPTEAQTSSLDVEIGFSRNVSGIDGNGTVVTANPSIDLRPPPAMRRAFSFEVENVDTGKSVTVAVESDEAPETLAAIFDINGAQGRVKRLEGTLDCWNDSRFVEVDVGIDGDEATFSEQNYAEYRITMRDEESVVDRTEPHVVPVAHPLEFEHSVEDGILEFSFNAGELPADADIHAVIPTPSGDVTVTDTEYDPSANRYVGRVSADAVPSGTYTARMTISEAATGIRILTLEGDVST
jgi:hypothetical protein